MNKQDVINAYNLYERQNLDVPGCKKLTTRELTRFVAPQDYGSFISYHQFDEQSTAAIIEREIEFFTQEKRSFEWKTYLSDTPTNLTKQLIARGFCAEEAESFMVFDLPKITQPLETRNLAVEVADEAGIRDAIDVQEKVWGGDLSGHYHHLVTSKKHDPEALRIYVIYQNGEPVSSAWIVFNSDSPFAGIWGGSTVEAYRGNGYYTELLHIRINLAKQYGREYLMIDASKMSRPIVERHGFVFIDQTTPYIYNVSKTAEIK
ncbi:GNAT family N-acetyltransferase [Vibrio tapetis]|uniref:N-acetyltransferase domain-containing protein n=1 Tax=Vibrio tapetis subsp. tapetis TaxID=1671868 RepID=A0A2N8ZJE5_9VIBR|nr:GNAT family N-acetyltransferase [Vibrio tapetis]SON52007.1 conserved protein of unknown function [Vibrio tapetis subsp. tapetis]